MCDDMDYWIEQDQYNLILNKFLDRIYNQLQVNLKDDEEADELAYYIKMCDNDEPAYYRNYWG